MLFRSTWTGGGTAVFDGVTLSDGDRVLIKDGTGLTNAKGNGIWVYNLGANTFSRATDANNLTTENLATGISSELRSGVFVFVEQGTVWGSTGWVLSTPATGTVTIGTDLVQFSQFSRSTGIYADDGLGQDGNRVYVKTDGTTIYIDSNDEVAVRSSNTQYQSYPEDPLILAKQNAANIDFLKGRVDEVMNLKQSVTDISMNMTNMQTQLNTILEQQQEYEIGRAHV